MTILLHVTGTPRPKQSMRWVAGRAVSVAAARSHLKAWTGRLKAEANRWRRAGGQPLEGALRCDIDFYFATKKRERWGQPHTFTPDKDNIEKAVLDAIKGIAFKDDARVSSGLVSKWWAETAGAVIVLKILGSNPESLESGNDDLGAQQMDAPEEEALG